MKTILCYGDSNTWGHDPRDGSRIPYGARWTSLLQQQLGSGYLVCEEGLNGRTTVFDDPIEPFRNGLAYLTPCLLINRPVDLIIFMLGTNDVKAHLGQTAFSISKGLERLILSAQDPLYGPDGNIPEILIVSPIEIGERVGDTWLGDYFDPAAQSKVRALKPLYKDLAQRCGCHFMAASDHALPSPADEVHLDAENHGKLALAFVGRVREILG